jgi:cytochrome c oxidase cbb3-type subunit 4
MTMDMSWIRSMMTVMAFATFIGIALWAWSSSKKGDFDRAARSVLEDVEPAMHDYVSNKQGGGHE